MIKLIACLCVPLLLLVSPARAEEDTLVRWHDQALTRLDFEGAMQSASPEIREEFRHDMKRITGVLESLLIQRTLSQEARTLGLADDPLVQKEIQLATERILAKKRLEAFEAGLKQPDYEAVARQDYTTKPDEFRLPEQLDASHILIAVSTCRKRDAAQALAEEIRQKALAGEDFAALADAHSDDPSAARNHGELGQLPRGKLIKAFEEAVLALKPGEIGPVVETKFGFHVIRLNKIVPGRLKSFDEVKTDLVKKRRDQFLGDERDIFLSKIKNDPGIQLNTSAIDSLIVK
jgi:peptidyl-prolyl cis-trans isomerase C